MSRQPAPSASSVASERIQLAADALCLRLSGVIDERCEAGAIFKQLPTHVVVDLSGIKRITSFGVRQWSDAMKGIPSSVRHLYALSAPACFVDQLNMVLNFGGRTEVLTATALYFCDRCAEERAVAIDVLGDHSLLSSGAAPPAPCPSCGTPMALEDDPQQAFRYVAAYGCQKLEPTVAAALDQHGLYTPRRVGPPPEEMKLVHGDVTLLVLSGTLDQRFRPRRLASGVEGEVVLDVGGVGAIDATGAERFRQLLSSLEEAGSVTLVDVPASLLREIAGGGLPLGRAQLYSALLQFQCAACGAGTRGSLSRAQGASSRPPCDRCGEPTLLAGSGTWVERAFAQPAPQTLPVDVEDLIARRAELLSRARAESGARATQSDTALGRYRVLRPLSRGGMAEILLAVHEGIGGFEKLIALKKIRRKLLERRHVAVELFLNEAKIVANLNHPNIVQTFEVGEHGGDLFIAMEYVHGVDARTVVKHQVESGDKLGLDHILYLGTQVAAALDHAHKARDLSGRPLHIVHRDVSLSNIVI
ncbi:MAG TPA: protein kinase, partial [Planctomycetota bacterium]|nr:protein kinase [Planctomycetota bacterium]